MEPGHRMPVPHHCETVLLMGCGCGAGAVCHIAVVGAVAAARCCPCRAAVPVIVVL